MEEIIKKCNSYDKQVGCYNTFDGKCNKENCQIYNLLQENAELKEVIKSINKPIAFPSGEEEVTNKYKQALEEIRGIINNHTKCFYGSCKDCLYYQECDMQNRECDCSKYHIDKINEVLEDE